MSPAQTSVTAKISSPPPKLRVNCLRTPIKEGPTKPPTLPSEFIKAIPPAAAVPRKNSGGNDQKGPSVDQRPAAARQRAASAASVLWLWAASTSPTAPTKAASARCHRRSPLRSEDTPTITIATAAQKYGSAERRPTSRLLKLPSPLTICGRKKAIP